VERRGWTSASGKGVSMVELETGHVVGDGEDYGAWCYVQFVVFVDALNV
jgi:hypothetical protein